MAPKKQQKKQQKKGVDFQKIKRKIGRKLQPPKNATNIEIKSKPIILPEQSVASEKVGLAVNKKGLTLKELLQQTSHHNAKVRKDAVLGLRDLLNKHSSELNLHKYAIVEKLRERISDDDSSVRGSLYELFKTVIFPGCKEDTQGVCVSLLTTYIFKAMMDLAIEVRLMAFKFLDLVVNYYPNSFFLHAEKILQNYEDLFRKNKSYLHEKGKLMTHLDGLVRCLSLLPSRKREDSHLKKDAEQKLLFAFDSDLPTEHNDYSTLIPKVKDVVRVLVDCFVDFIPSVQGGSPLDAQSFDCMMCLLQSIIISIKFFLCFAGKDKLEPQFPCGETDANVGPDIISNISEVLIKRLLVVFPINSVLQLSGKADERYFTLNKAIAEIYLHLREWISGSSVSLEIYLEFIERTLLKKMSGGKSVNEKHLLSLLPFIPKLVSVAENHWKSRLLQAFTTAFLDCKPESSLKLACLTTINEMLFSREGTMYPDDILDYHISWIRELPALLIILGDNLQSSSQDVLRLLLKVGQCAPMNPSITWEFDNLQISLQPFFSTCLNNGTVSYGPFVRLPSELQELSLCCVCYFSYLDPELLKSISHCCLCPDLDPSALLRIVEVLNSSYEAGRIQIADHISFLTTLLSSFRVYPDDIFAAVDKYTKLSKHQTFKSLSAMVCSYISQIGDNSVVLQIMEDIILDRISSGLPLDNLCAMLRLLCTLDSKPTTLSEQSVTSLGTSLSKYLIDIAQLIPKEDDENRSKTLQYYTVPCYLMFDKSHELLQLVLRSFTLSLRRSDTENRNAKDCSGLLDALATILQVFHKDPKIRAMVSSTKEDVACVSQENVCLESSWTGSILEERHNIRCAVDRLKIAVSAWV